MKTTDIKNLARQIDTFTLAYIEAALWSSTDDDGRPLDDLKQCCDDLKQCCNLRQ